MGSWPWYAYLYWMYACGQSAWPDESPLLTFSRALLVYLKQPQRRATCSTAAAAISRAPTIVGSLMSDKLGLSRSRGRLAQTRPYARGRPEVLTECHNPGPHIEPFTLLALPRSLQQRCRGASITQTPQSLPQRVSRQYSKDMTTFGAGTEKRCNTN